MYRYDGLYTIVRMIDNEGRDTTQLPAMENSFVMPQHTFFMTRNPTEQEVEHWRIREGHLDDVPFRLGGVPYTIPVPSRYYNLKSGTELWNEIQAARKVPLEVSVNESRSNGKPLQAMKKNELVSL